MTHTSDHNITVVHVANAAMAINKRMRKMEMSAKRDILVASAIALTTLIASFEGGEEEAIKHLKEMEF